MLYGKLVVEGELIALYRVSDTIAQPLPHDPRTLAIDLPPRERVRRMAMIVLQRNYGRPERWPPHEYDHITKADFDTLALLSGVEVTEL